MWEKGKGIGASEKGRKELRGKIGGVEEER